MSRLDGKILLHHRRRPCGSTPVFFVGFHQATVLISLSLPLACLKARLIRPVPGATSAMADVRDGHGERHGTRAAPRFPTQARLPIAAGVNSLAPSSSGPTLATGSRPAERSLPSRRVGVARHAIRQRRLRQNRARRPQGQSATFLPRAYGHFGTPIKAVAAADWALMSIKLFRLAFSACVSPIHP